MAEKVGGLYVEKDKGSIWENVRLGLSRGSRIANAFSEIIAHDVAAEKMNAFKHELFLKSLDLAAKNHEITKEHSQ